MTLFLAGNRLTCDLLNDNSAEETTSSGLVAADNFTTQSFSGYRSKGVTTINIFVQRTTGSLSEGGSNTGNLADTALCTLPEDWRPPEDVNTSWGNGFNDGECIITTSGTVTLRSTSGTSCVPNLSNIRILASWISG